MKAKKEDYTLLLKDIFNFYPLRANCFGRFLCQKPALNHKLQQVKPNLSLKGDLMNDFDTLIEKYSRELVNTKRRSILSEIEEVEKPQEVMPVISEIEPENPDSISQNNNFDEADDFDPLLLATNEPEEDLTAQEDIMEFDDGLEDFDESFNESDNREYQLENFDLKEERNNGNSELSDNVEAQNAANSAYGTLRVQVFAADQVYPIASANVVVTENEKDDVLFQGYTDSSGIIDNILLPAPSREMSEAPTRLKPYAQYDVTVSHPRFAERKYIGVPVFDGIKSIQTVQLVPTTNGNGQSQTVTESEPNDLLLKLRGE